MEGYWKLKLSVYDVNDYADTIYNFVIDYLCKKKFANLLKLVSKGPKKIGTEKLNTQSIYVRSFFLTKNGFKMWFSKNLASASIANLTIPTVSPNICTST